MLKRIIWLCTLLIVSVALGGCEGEAAPLPTLASIGGPTAGGPTAGGPAVTGAETAAAPAATNTRAPRELPPTWTPLPSATPIPSATPPPTDAPLVAATGLPECQALSVDRARSTTEFPLGQFPTLAWTPVEGTLRYYVVLQKPDPNTGDLVDVMTRYVVETQLTITPELYNGFALGDQYGWFVYPLNLAGDQFCIPVGDAVLVTR
jgi:hypothetical protein